MVAKNPWCLAAIGFVVWVAFLGCGSRAEIGLTSPLSEKTPPSRIAPSPYPAVTADLRNCIVDRSISIDQLVTRGCVFPEQRPSSEGERNVLRIRRTEEGRYHRIDNAELETNGVIALEFINDGTLPVVIEGEPRCGGIHTQIVGIVEEDYLGGPCFSYPAFRVLLPGQAVSAKFDFRVGGGDVSTHDPIPQDNLWPLPDGCYEMRFSFGAWRLEEAVRVCYRRDSDVRDPSFRHRASCNTVSGKITTEWPFDIPREELTDPNIVDSSGWTPVMWAAENGDAEFAMDLLKRGANPNANNGTYEALGLALQHQNFEIAELLLRYGAAPSMMTVSRHFRAPAPELEQILERIAEGWRTFPSIERKATWNRPGPSVLSLLMRTDAVVALEKFTEGGGSLQCEGPALTHPLINAAETCSAFAAEYALEHGGGYPQEILDSALAVSAGHGCYFLTSILLKHGASLVSEFGKRAILEAARANELNIVRLLVEHGANPETRLSDGFVVADFDTSIECRPVWRMESIEESLWKLDKSAYEKAQKAPAFLAERRRADTLLKGKCGAGRAQLEQRAQKNAAGRSGTTVLMEVLDSHGEICESVEVLLDSGAKANTEDDEGRGALERLAAGGSWSNCVAEKLIAHGADVNHADRDGQTALIRLVRRNAYSANDAVYFLLSRGANVQAKDRSGKTALEYARILKEEEIIVLLENASRSMGVPTGKSF